jgi:hypothetical protein
MGILIKEILMRRYLLAKVFAPAAIISGALASASAQETQKSSNPDAPEVDACRAAGLIALKETAPAIKDVAVDPDSVRVYKMDKKIGDEPVRAVVIGDVSIEKTKSSKPRSLVCIVGDKGKVLVTYFTAQ